MNKTFVGMNIYTEFGDFVRFKDVATFMRLENKNTIFISSADWWGAEFVKNTTFTKDEIRQIIEGA